jgi:cell division protein FtsA
MATTDLFESARRTSRSSRDAAPLPGRESSTAVAAGLVTRLGLEPPTRTRTLTGVDIGTTKICAVIGEIDPSGRTTIKGIASTPSQGLRRGVVIDLDETVASIRTAIEKAEEIAQVSVRDVLVGIAGGHIQCHHNEATVEVAHPERGISRTDIRRAIDKAVADKLPVEREMIHTIPQRFRIDDGVVVNPEGFSSRILGVEVLTVTAAVTSAQNIVRAVRQAGYRVGGIYLEPLASSLSIVTPEEKDLGVVVVDIGGGTSDIAIWANGAVRYTGVVPFGGDAITEDIRRGLKVGTYDAENIKKRHGNCLPASVRPEETIEVPMALTGKPQAVNRQFLCEIIESRMAEMLSMVREACEKSQHYGKAYAGVILTGGGALQSGCEQLAEKIFERPCKIGRPWGLSGLSSVASSPIYSTGVGLLLQGLQHDHEFSGGDANAFQKTVRFFKKAIDWY